MLPNREFGKPALGTDNEDLSGCTGPDNKFLSVISYGIWIRDNYYNNNNYEKQERMNMKE
jgi:hypothetical protein